MSKTQELQKLVNDVPRLAGYRVEYCRPSFYLRHAQRPAIYLPSGKVAVQWIGIVKATGRDHAAMRRQK